MLAGDHVFVLLYFNLFAFTFGKYGGTGDVTDDIDHGSEHIQQAVQSEDQGDDLDRNPCGAKYNRERFAGKLIALTGSSGKTSTKEGQIRIGGKQDDVEEHLCVRRTSEARLHLQVCVLIYFITCTCALQIYVCIATYYCSKNGIEKIKCHPYDVIVAIVTCAGASLRVGRATLPRCSRNASLITAFVIHSTPT